MCPSVHIQACICILSMYIHIYVCKYMYKYICMYMYIYVVFLLPIYFIYSFYFLFHGVFLIKLLLFCLSPFVRDRVSCGFHFYFHILLLSLSLLLMTPFFLYSHIVPLSLPCYFLSFLNLTCVLLPSKSSASWWIYFTSPLRTLFCSWLPCEDL